MFKKALLTLSLMAVVGMITAQSLQFEYEGTVYDEGQTINVPFNEDLGEYIKEFHIRNLTDNQLDVMVEKEVINDLAGTDIYFCWGECFSSTVFVSDPVSIPAQTLSSSELSFHVFFDQAVVGQVIVKLYAFTRSNPDEKISVILTAGSGTNTAENYFSLGHAYPNPASSQVHFDLNIANNSNINVVVYNLLGQEVKSQLVNGSQSRVNIAVDDMQPGIYFCRFSINGEVVKTEKFIVKR